MVIWDNVLEFKCTYQQNGVTKDNYRWSGFINRWSNLGPDIKTKTNGRGLVSSFEGVIVDEQIKEVLVTNFLNGKTFKRDYADERFLFGAYGMYHPEGIVKFTIMPLKGSLIDYEFMYDEEDDCLYGVWYFVNEKEKNSNYGGFARLEIQQNVGIKEEEVEYNIDKCQAYEKHADTVSTLIEKDIPNIQNHDDADPNRFIDAKKYFIKYDEMKRMERESQTVKKITKN